jgi:hypothetical protein
MTGETVDTRSPKWRITGRLVAAGRALVGVSIADFAAACRLPAGELARLEAGGSAWIQSGSEVDALRRGFNHFGIVVVEETDTMGAGVRLKFTRSDVRQIARLEGEGGRVASDDAP